MEDIGIDDLRNLPLKLSAEVRSELIRVTNQAIENIKKRPRKTKADYAQIERHEALMIAILRAT